MGMKQVQSVKQYPILVYAGIGVSLVIVSLTLFYFIGSINDGSAAEPDEFVWTGAKSSEWSDTSNWLAKRIPHDEAKVVVEENAFKSPIIEPSEIIELHSLVLSGGKGIKILGELQIEKDISITSKGTVLELFGILNVQKDMSIKLRSEMTVFEGGMLFVGENVNVEWAEIRNAGTIRTKGDLRLKRKSSRFISNGGFTMVDGSLQLHSSSGERNQLVINDGDFTIVGNTSFFRLYEGQYNSGNILVKGGKMSLKGLDRNEDNPGTLAGAYSISVQGGALVFNGDAIFDTLPASDSLADRRLGFGVAVWEPKRTYARQDANEIIAVSLEGSVFWLSQDIWWSREDNPENSKVWIKKGNAKDLHPGKNCSCIPWDKTSTYKRSEADEEIYVAHANKVYRMNKSCWYSKENEPGKNEWAWTSAFDCEQSFTAYSDKVNLTGGSITFHGRTTFPPGFKCSPQAMVILSGQGVAYNIPATMNFGTLEIDSGSSMSEETLLNVLADFKDENYRTKSAYSLNLIGATNQTLMGSNGLVLDRLLVQKDSGTIVLTNSLVIQDSILWKTPTVIVPGSGTNKDSIELIFEENGAYTGNGWFEGTVVKKGKNAFVFPLGMNGKRGFIGISERSIASTYTATYNDGPCLQKGVLGHGLNRVSNIEHWVVETFNGEEEIWPTLHWHSGNISGIEKPKDLVIAVLEENQWVSMGQRFSKGNANSGSITADHRSVNPGILTFGTLSSANSLRIQTNPSESKEGYAFHDMETLGTRRAEGESVLASLEDDLEAPEINTALKAFPNPVKNHFVLQFMAPYQESASLTVYNASGLQIYAQSLSISEGENQISLDGSLMMPRSGNYVLILNVGGTRRTIRLVKQ